MDSIKFPYRTSRTVLLAIVFFLGIWAWSPASRAEDPNDLLIVANKTVPVDTTTPEELRVIFFKKKTSWKRGREIQPIHAPTNSPERKAFARRVLGKSHQEAHRAWNDRQVMYGIIPPPELPSDDHARLRRVFSTKGAISYVWRKDYLEGVTKILLVLPPPPMGRAK
jgi:hypothetical protein